MEATNLYKIVFCGAYFGTVTAFFLSWLIWEIKRKIRTRNFLKSMEFQELEELPRLTEKDRKQLEILEKKLTRIDIMSIIPDRTKSELQDLITQSRLIVLRLLKP